MIARLGVMAAMSGLALAGCSSAPAPVQCTVDADCTAPGSSCRAGSCQLGAIVTITSPASGIAVKGPLEIQVAISGIAADQIELLVNDAPLASVPRPYAYTWNTTGSPEGTYVLKAQLTAAGRVFESAPVQVIVDRTAPASPVLSPLPSPTTIASVQLSGTAEPGARLTFYVGTVEAGTTTASAAGAFSQPVTLPGPGTYAVTATATDAAGNVSAPSEAATVQLMQQSCTGGVATCADAETLSTCRPDGSVADLKACPLGCSSVGVAHCRVLIPTAPVASSDLTLANVAAVSIPGGEAIFNVDTGEIAGALTRPANQVFTATEVVDGIGYRLQDGVGIFVFAALTVAPGATVKLTGAAGAALVSSSDVTMRGIVEARPMDATGSICPATASSAGPGGGHGGAASTGGPPPTPAGQVGAGPGGGSGGLTANLGSPAGGAGGGHGAPGGKAGDGYRNGLINVAGGPGGVAYDAGGVLGGSGGGGSGTPGGHGGGGGGAVRLVAGGTVTIGNGTVAAGVNAGGCGGLAHGGGGGSGGAIIVEAAIVQLSALGVLAANGGGGANDVVGGASGALGSAAAFGGGSSQFSSGGGNGGADASPAGEDAVSSPTAQGYGGGGAAGRIHVLTRTGTPTVHAAAVVSPAAALGTVASQ